MPMAGMARNGSDSAAPMVASCGVGVVERCLRDDARGWRSPSDDVGASDPAEPCALFPMQSRR